MSRLPLPPEKAFQLFTAFIRKTSAGNRRLVIVPRVAQHLESAARCTGLGVHGAKHDVFKPGMNHRTSTHAARFQRDVHCAPDQTVVAQVLAGIP